MTNSKKPGASELTELFTSHYVDEMDPLLAALTASRSSLGMVDIDIANEKVTWSNRFREIAGILPGTDIPFNYLFSIIHPDDLAHVEKVTQDHYKSKAPYSFQHRVIRPSDKKIIWVATTGQYLLNDAGVPVRAVSSSMDITELKEAELRAIESDRAKSEFLANMSHEIRTPMNGIMGVAELLQNCELGPRATDFVNIINRSSNALLTIINDILDFSKIQAGQLELDVAPFHLRDAIEDVTALLSTKISETGIDLLLRVQPDLPSTFLGDAGRFRQILTNIVGNAVKFTHTGHVLIDVSGEISDGIADLVIKVVDTGIGIDKKKFSLVFEKFSQADGSTTRQYGGTGLGLPISQNLVELMGGDISVDSVVGEGTTFTISIALPVEKDIIGPKLEQLNIAGSKILVIDDNEVNRDILKEQLSYWKCKCVAAPSAKIGLAVLDRAKEKNVNLDLIIVDYQMPEANGEDFVKALKASADHAQIPVIMLSSVDKAELRQRMNALDIAAFLTKPTRGSVLHDQMAEALCRESVKQVQPKETKEATGLIPAVNKPSTRSGHVDVLIAEDNEVNQMYARYVMEDLALSYKIVPNGRIAVEKWKLLSPKIILMDISMPEMNGYEATAAIRKIEAESNLPRTPIMAVTAHALKSDKDVCLEHDMDDYLSKPLSIKFLEDKLMHWGVLDNSFKSREAKTA